MCISLAPSGDLWNDCNISLWEQMSDVFKKTPREAMVECQNAGIRRSARAGRRF